MNPQRSKIKIKYNTSIYYRLLWTDGNRSVFRPQNNEGQSPKRAFPFTLDRGPLKSACPICFNVIFSNSKQPSVKNKPATAQRYCRF